MQSEFVEYRSARERFAVPVPLLRLKLQGTENAHLVPIILKRRRSGPELRLLPVIHFLREENISMVAHSL